MMWLHEYYFQKKVSSHSIHMLANLINLSLTCAISSVLHVHSKSLRLVHDLPSMRGAVLIVGVHVVGVSVLPCENGGT